MFIDMESITFNVIIALINFMFAHLTISIRGGQLYLSTILEFNMTLIASGIIIVLIDGSSDSSLIGRIMVMVGVLLVVFAVFSLMSSRGSEHIHSG